MLFLRLFQEVILFFWFKFQLKNLINNVFVMLFELLKKKLSGRKKEIAFIVLVFLLAFGVRGHLIQHQLFFEFDSYYHGRMAEYWITSGTIPVIDPMAYYQLPEGGSKMPSVGYFFWVFTGTIFTIVYKILTLNAPYSKDAWIIAIKFFPAIFGALISVAMYFLGKEMYDKKTGIVFAFFAAIVPAFVYRTMAGFFEDDSLGFLPMIIAMVFFVRAMKNAEFNKSTVLNSVLAAFFMFVMAITWQGFGFAWMIYPPYFVATVIMMFMRREPVEKIINLSKNFAIFFLLMTVSVTIVLGPWWLSFAIDNVGNYLPISKSNIEHLSTGRIDDKSVFSVSIGEESQGIKYWFNKYNALIIFPVIALLIYAIAIFFAIFEYFSKPSEEKAEQPKQVNILLKRPGDYVSFLVLFWILLCMTMAYVKLKYTYVFGLPVAAAAGVVFFEIFQWIGPKPSFEKKFVAVSFGFMFLVGAAAGTYFVSQNYPNIEENTGWKEALYWLRDNTPPGSKIFNWWDEGHWISFIAERRVSSDNRNYSTKVNAEIAKFILSSNPDEAKQIIDKYGSDYIILEEGMLSRLNPLVLYAYETDSVSPEKLIYYNTYALPCNKQKDLSNQVIYNCSGIQMNEAQYLSLPYKRIEQPNVPLDQKTKAFAYRDEEGQKLFLLNKASNDTMLARLFFAPESISWVQKVYDKKEVKIYKVVK